MDITYLGHSSFRIKGKANTIICDPFDSSVGLKYAKQEADIVTVSHDHGDHNNLDGVKDYKKVVSSPGEYEINGTSFFGIPSYHDDKKGAERGKNTIFVINIDGINICHLGDLGQKSLTESQLTAIGNVDILLIPVGGTYTISADEAVSIMQSIEPKIVIPMHYKTPQHEEKTYGTLDTFEKFVSESGLKSETLPKLSYKPGDLPEEEQRLYILEIK